MGAPAVDFWDTSPTSGLGIDYRTAGDHMAHKSFTISTYAQPLRGRKSGPRRLLMKTKPSEDERPSETRCERPET